MIECGRCGDHVIAVTGSYFDDAVICIGCRSIERTHPLYQAAQQRETAEVAAGNYNFPGVGLPLGFEAWLLAQPPTDAEVKAAKRRLDPYLRGHPSPMIDARRLRITTGNASICDQRQVKAEDVVLAEIRGGGAAS